MGTAPRNSSHVRGKRGAVVGWSAGAARRNTRFLYSIEVDSLSGVGFALTLTLADIPVTAVEWGQLRRAWIKRVNRLGAVRLHWIVEWQRRGAPHLHVAVYFPESAVWGVVPGVVVDSYRVGVSSAPEGVQPISGRAGSSDPSISTCFPVLAVAPRHSVSTLGSRMVDDWLEISSRYRSGLSGQDCKPIDGVLGWLQYLGKHASRGAAHYQRSGHPEGWEKTGRLWGHVGDWPEGEPMVFDLEPLAGVRFRRLVRSWRIADARKEVDRPTRARRVLAARRMLRCTDRQLSPVRGVSEWLTQDMTIALVIFLAAEGWKVTQRAVD